MELRGKRQKQVTLTSSTYGIQNSSLHVIYYVLWANFNSEVSFLISKIGEIIMSWRCCEG